MDARIAGRPGGTGVSVYGMALAEAVQLAGFGLERLVDGPGHGRARRWIQAATQRRPWPAPLDAPGRRHAGDTFRIAQVQFDMRRRFLALQDRAPPALMHWTYPLPMRFAGVPNLYTVHDLIPLLHPALTGIAPGRMRRLLDGLHGAAAHLVTVSETSRAEIIRVLGWPPERVTNTYQAVLGTAPPASDTAAALARLGLQPGGYIVHAGSVEPRKNVRRLVEAYRASGIRIPLVVAGPDGWRAAAELAGLAATPGLIRLPWVDRPTLLALLSGARFVAAPSLAEGFGLVVAEAMAFGTPVLTSALGATMEVAGDVALLVDPTDPAALVEALRTLTADAPLRAELRARGLHRAAMFTPAAYAARLAALYRRVLAVSPLQGR